MSVQVLIAHAEGEEELAETLATPIRAAGYDVSHRGTVMVGESFNEEASKALLTGGPVVLCGTVKAIGTGWAHRLVHAARQTNRARIFVVQMEQAAYVEQLSLDTAIARYWQDQAQAEKDLINALKKFYPPHLNQQSFTLVNDAERRYRELALASCDIIDLANLPETDRHVATRQIELRRLYVPLRVRVEVASGIEAKAAHIEAIEQKQRSLRGPFSDLSGGFAQNVDDDPRSRVSIGHRLAAAKRLVVLGDAGSGKTTLIRWIATAYLLRLKEDADLRNLPDVATLPYNDWLPIIVRCRDLDQFSLTGSLNNLLLHTLTKAELREAEIDALRSRIIERLTQGQAILLVDGLDEITDPSLRARFCQQLESIQIAYPSAPIVVTSRTVGYREMGDRLGRGFEHVAVAELTKEDKDYFARRWCLLTERTERQTEATAELIHDIHSTDRIERLTRNPMLLTTMALVKRKVGRLPSRRADLYWDALEVLLNWRREVDQPIDHREALPQLEYIAFAMCERGIQQIRQDELLDLLQRMRGEYAQIRALERHTPEEFLHILERRTGIIVEAGHVRHLGRPFPTYEFRHLTFQEYLAGLALVEGRFPGRDRSKSLAANVGPLAGRVVETNPKDGKTEQAGHSENWTEALRLCVASCNDDDVDDVLSAILDATDDKAQTRRPRAILAALCLADEPNVSQEVALGILTHLVSEITIEDGSGPIRTGVDVAIKELSTSAWAPPLAEMLIRQFVSRSEPPRSAFGSLYGVTSAASAPASDTQFGEWLEELSLQLSNQDESRSIGAALTIMDLGYRNRIELVPGMITSLMYMLDKSVAMADAASWALRWLNHRRTKNRWRPTTELARLVELVKDPSTDSHVVRNLILILGEERDRRAVPILLDKLDSQDKRIEKAAIAGLGRIGDADAAPSLVAKLDSPDGTTRGSVVQALGSLKNADTIGPLLNQLRDEDETVRSYALEALNNFQDERVTPSLIAALTDSSELVRLVAASTLGDRRDPLAVEPLIQRLQDESPLVQNESAAALGKIGDPKAEAYLLHNISNENPAVRAAATRALGQMASTHLVDAIVGGLKDESSDVRSAAEFTLLGMALRQFSANDLPAAVDIFSRMVTIIPNEDYRNDLAYCLILGHQYQDAAQHYDLIDLSFSFNAPLYRHNRGVLFFLMGDPTKGVQYIKESLSMISLNTEYEPRDVACMLVLQSGEVVHSVNGIPLDAAAIINLCIMGELSQDDTVTELLTRYPHEGEQWLPLLEPSVIG